MSLGRDHFDALAALGLGEDDPHGGPREREDEDDDDPFEKEMEAELARRAQKAEAEGGLRARLPSPVMATGSKKKPDDDLSDSDSEDEIAYAPRIKGNDQEETDLLYDPDADDEDARYAEAKRVRVTGQQGKGGKKAVNSDAVLNCPACFTLLCVDCQRHDLYDNQFRAMFVENVSVLYDQRLRFPLSKSGRKRKGDRHSGPPDADEVFHPVRCVHCSTEVAMFDQQEIYHFFNVIPSH